MVRAVSMRFTHNALVTNRAVSTPLPSPQINKRKGKRLMEAFAKCYTCRMRLGEGGRVEEEGLGGWEIVLLWGRRVGGEGEPIFKEVGERFTNLCHSQILRVLLSACGGEEDNVVNGLDELQLHHTANQQPLEQLLVRGLDFWNNAKQDPAVKGTELLKNAFSLRSKLVTKT